MITNDTDSVNFTLQLLNEGDKNIVLDHHKNVVLILGDTGSGKSTITQVLAGDSDNLISYEVGVDTGVFLIDDLNDKISKNSTIFSKTIYPELVVAKETDTAYYDCPGFSYIRSAAMDIASTYFIRKVLDHAEKVKLIFTVNHNSVKIGRDRIDFMKLMKHATTLIKNIDKFKESIVLIVTKVDNSYKVIDGVPTLITDSQLLANVENFLTSTKNDIESKLESNKNQDKEIIKLIDILLSKREEKLSRIALFRRPVRSGKLSQIELSQMGKEVIKNMIHQSLNYTKKNNEDFGYTISDDSKNYVISLVEGINSEITLNVKKISSEIVKYYDKEEQLTKDLYDLKHKCEMGATNTTKLLNIINPSTQPKDLIKEFQNFNIPQLQIFSENIRIHENHFNFLEKISEKKYKYKINEWKNALTEAANFLNISIDFYNFLIVLLRELSEYEVQLRLKNYSVSFLRNKFTKIMNSVELNLGNIIKSILDVVWENLSWPNNITNMFESIKNMKLDLSTVQKYLFFFKMLDITLKSPTSVDVLTGVLRVRGDFVFMSEINKEIAKNEDIVGLEIYAFNKFFFDQDLRKSHEKFKVVVVAITWEVIGKRTIQLDCTLIGLGANFLNFENLEIFANSRREVRSANLQSEYNNGLGELLLLVLAQVALSKIEEPIRCSDLDMSIFTTEAYVIDSFKDDLIKYGTTSFYDVVIILFKIRVEQLGIKAYTEQFQNYYNSRDFDIFIERNVSNFVNQLNNTEFRSKTLTPRRSSRLRRSLSKTAQYNYESMANNSTVNLNRITSSNNNLSINYENQTWTENTSVDFSVYNLNSTLALMDYFTRKYFGSERNSTKRIEDISYSDYLIYSLNIVEDYEKLLANLSKKIKLSTAIKIDGPHLVGQLQKLISQKNTSEISKALYDSVIINNESIERDSKFGNKLQKLIMKLLEKYIN